MGTDACGIGRLAVGDDADGIEFVVNEGVDGAAGVATIDVSTELEDSGLVVAKVSATRLAGSVAEVAYAGALFVEPDSVSPAFESLFERWFRVDVFHAVKLNEAIVCAPALMKVDSTNFSNDGPVAGLVGDRELVADVSAVSGGENEAALFASDDPSDGALRALSDVDHKSAGNNSAVVAKPPPFCTAVVDLGV